MKKLQSIIGMAFIACAVIATSGPKTQTSPCCFPNSIEAPWGSSLYWSLSVLQGDWENWSTMAGTINKDFSALELDNKGADGRESILRLQAWPGSEFLQVRTNNQVITMIGSRGEIVTHASIKVINPDGLIVNCPDGGSFVLKVANDGSLSTVTNSAGL